MSKQSKECGEEQPQNSLSTARLSSIASECNDLKDSYEKCFFRFFPRFLQGEKFTVDPCERRLSAYRDCVRLHVEKKMGVDLKRVDGTTMSASEIAERVANEMS